MTELQLEHVELCELESSCAVTVFCHILCGPFLPYCAVCTASYLCVRVRSCLQSLMLCIALMLECMVHKAAMGGGAVEPSTHCRGVRAHLLPSPLQGSVSKIGHCLRASTAAKA